MMRQGGHILHAVGAVFGGCDHSHALPAVAYEDASIAPVEEFLSVRLSRFGVIAEVFKSFPQIMAPEISDEY